MESLSHPGWCVRHDDGIHHSQTLRMTAAATSLSDVAAHLWQLDEQPPLFGIALSFTFGAEADSRLLDLGQAGQLAEVIGWLLETAGA
jgi:hypothetical protein